MSEINGRTVLIAEDHAKTRKCLEESLVSLGYDVVAAAKNGEDAVKLAEEHRPSLVIMDVKMPKKDGIEAAGEISALYTVPIILVTGVTDEEVANKAVEAGVFAYLVKPVTKKQLEPAIRIASARFEQFEGLRGEVSDLKEAIEVRKVIEKAKGIVMKRCNLSEEEAFKLLQSHSQKENKKMIEIAESVISASKLM